MRYQELYDIEKVSEAMKECVEIGAYHKNSVKRILSCKELKIPSLEIFTGIYISEPYDIKRPLSEYRVEVSYE